MAGGAGRAPAGDLRLRLIATSDLHAQLLPHDYYADQTSAIGLALAAPLIRALRDEALGRGDAVLLLDNGDLLQGSLIADWLVTVPDEAGTPHPMIEAMNALGFDAATLGNHDFNFGLPFLRRAYERARFAVVSANVLTDRGEPLVAPSVILDREARDADGRLHLLRIGVLGLAPPQIPVWDRRILGGAVATRDILETAGAEVRSLRAAGADLVVALCHSGLGPLEAEPMMENAVLPLAAAGLVDAIIAGHTHEVFPDAGRRPEPGVDLVAGTVFGVPTVQPGSHGRHVGVIDLDLHPQSLANGGRTARWRIVKAWSQALRVSPADDRTNDVAARIDPTLAALAAPVHARLLAQAAEPVGASRVALQSYFSLVASDAALDVVADAQRDHARRLLAGTSAETLPILVAVAPFRAGGRGGPRNYVDVPPGPLALRQAAGLYVFPNGVAIVEVTGAGIVEWLERGASIYGTLEPGRIDQPLLDPDFPSYNFETLDGLDWTVDPTRPPRTDPHGRVVDAGARRILDLRHGGRPVAPTDRFAVATNSYRLAAGGGFAAAAGARRLVESTRQVRDVVISHVRRVPLDPAPRPRWRFAAHPGTAAWFDTGPGALDHLAGSDRALDDLGEAPEGFRRLRLRL